MLKIIYLLGTFINLCILIKALYNDYKRNLPITLGDLYFMLCCCILSVLVTPFLLEIDFKDYILFQKKHER